MVYSAVPDIQYDLKMLSLLLEIVFHKFLLIVKHLHMNKADCWSSERMLQPGW